MARTVQCTIRAKINAAIWGSYSKNAQLLLVASIVCTVGANNMFTFRSELRCKTSCELRANFARTSRKLRTNFAQTSGQLHTNFGPTSRKLRANFARTSGQLRANFARTSGQLRTNFGPSSYESNFGPTS